MIPEYAFSVTRSETTLTEANVAAKFYRAGLLRLNLADHRKLMDAMIMRIDDLNRQIDEVILAADNVIQYVVDRTLADDEPRAIVQFIVKGQRMQMLVDTLELAREDCIDTAWENVSGIMER